MYGPHGVLVRYWVAVTWVFGGRCDDVWVSSRALPASAETKPRPPPQVSLGDRNSGPVDGCRHRPFFHSLTGRLSVLLLHAVIGLYRKKEVLFPQLSNLIVNGLLDVKCRAPGI